MDEQKNKTNNGFIDLGSDPNNDDFDPFASDDDFRDEINTDMQEQQQSPKKETASVNTMEKAINKAEDKDAEQAQKGLFDKVPIFEYAGATENIIDTSKTFDELRIEKATDFPELEDGKRVSWTVEYGKIIKPVSDPKAVTIGKIKSEIETSKDFLESLKKLKDKNPSCKVKPRVTAQSKGTTESYKGVFISIADAETAKKVISIIPAKDGKVYEIRNTEMGKFITPASECNMLDNVRAGFIPALPPIPKDMMMKIVAFFRYYMCNGVDKEVLVNIYWDKYSKSFFIDTPKQTVSNVSVNSRINDSYSGDRYIHYMDIHSHNSMRAFFSTVDDNDEKATRLYTVIGNLHEYFPDIKTRISNGGKFLDIDPAEVFELVALPFPNEWKDNVHFRAFHSNEDIGNSIHKPLLDLYAKAGDVE